MRLIDADKLHKDISNGPGTDLQKFFADCCVAAASTVNPYEWISIEDRRPERGARVLCYYHYEPESPDVICENIYYGRKHDGYLWMSDSSKVTHWMSLPAQPIEKENQL